MPLTIIRKLQLDPTDSTLAGDVSDLRINILKTNFKVDTISGASRNKLVNVVVDLLNDTTGVDGVASSDWVYDSAMKGVKRAAAGMGALISREKSYTLNPAPNSNYGDSTGLELTDGTIVTANVNYTDTRWVGFGGYSSPVVTLDLGEIRGVTSTRGYFGSSTSSGIYYPDSMKVEVSTDGQAWTQAALIDLSGYVESEGSGGVITPNHADAIFTATQARFVRLTFAAGPGGWTFLNEVEVYFNDPTLKAKVVSAVEATVAAPAQVFLSVQENPRTGSIAYFASRDNGVTWTPIMKDAMASMSSQPQGTQLRIKAEITGEAELLAWAWGWA